MNLVQLLPRKRQRSKLVDFLHKTTGFVFSSLAFGTATCSRIKASIRGVTHLATLQGTPSITTRWPFL
jgi:hypothetical protein